MSCLFSEYTIMAESLERCFNRALLKHFPSEDADTDEEFHINKEEKERKERKRNRGSKHLGPESLIKATEQVQRKRNFQGEKGNAHSEEDNSKLSRSLPPPHWATQGLPPGQQHIRDGDMRALYHPGQQVRMLVLSPLLVMINVQMHLKIGESFKIVFCMFSCKFRHLPNANGAHMYAPRMAMDPRFGYQTHIPRHGSPSLSHVPHNFNMQVCKRGFTIKLQ